MKVIKIKLVLALAVNGSVFEVTYKKRGHGNKHFRMDVRADDEMGAYTKAIPLIEVEESEGFEKKLDDWEIIKKMIPTADINQDVKKIKRLKKLASS